MGDEGNGRRKGEKGGETRRGPNRLEISRLLPARRSACKSRPVRFWHPRPAKKTPRNAKNGRATAFFRWNAPVAAATAAAPHRAMPVQRSAACTSIIREWRMWLRAISSYERRDKRDMTEKGKMRKRKRLRFKSNIRFLNLNMVKIKKIKH